jgi:hypothetical protein
MLPICICTSILSTIIQKLLITAVTTIAEGLTTDYIVKQSTRNEVSLIKRTKRRGPSKPVGIPKCILFPKRQNSEFDWFSCINLKEPYFFNAIQT